MKRNALDALIKWQHSEDRKPMVLKGARQVGKTWLMKEFGQSTKEEKQESADNKLVIDKAEMQDSIQFKSQNYDANGDGHYDLLSAFQKSIRGSDTDAALYYLGNLCESGDLVAICRRLLVIAYEDVGLANPPACSRAVNAVQAAQMEIGRAHV